MLVYSHCLIVWVMLVYSHCLIVWVMHVYSHCLIVWVMRVYSHCLIVWVMRVYSHKIHQSTFFIVGALKNEEGGRMLLKMFFSDFPTPLSYRKENQKLDRPCCERRWIIKA